MSSEDEALSFEERYEQYETELRDKYTQAERDEMAKSGEAMPDGAYPIKDAIDLENAISTVGLGNASDSSIRAHIIKRAKALGLEAKLPDAWNADGSKTEKKSLSRRKERQRVVPLTTEVRFWQTDGLEWREKQDTDEICISGAPVVYDSPYTVCDLYGEFVERMAPGVATDVLERGCDTRFLINHSGIALARTVNDRGLPPTMTLTDTGTALRFEARLDARQQMANDLSVAIERGDLSSMSIGFSCARDSWNDAMDERVVHSFSQLLDVSAVTFPASPTTSIEIARRMALMIPLESDARSRKLYADVRAGKKMSASNASLVLEALHTLHTALGEAGAAVEVPGTDEGESNADALTPVDGTVSTVTPVGNEGDDQNLDEPFTSVVMDDGSQAGGVSGASEGYPGFADGSGLRSAPASKDERAEAQKDDPIYRWLADSGLEDVWVHSTDGGFVVYELFGEDGGGEDRGLYRLAFSTYDDGFVFDGDAERVVVRSEFVPVDAPVVPVAPSMPAVGRSARDLRLAMEARKRRR